MLTFQLWLFGMRCGIAAGKSVMQKVAPLRIEKNDVMTLEGVGVDFCSGCSRSACRLLRTDPRFSTALAPQYTPTQNHISHYKQVEHMAS